MIVKGKLMRSSICAAVVLLALYGPPASTQPAAYAPPAASAEAVRDVDFAAARPLDEDYRAQFDRCDRENIFRGVAMTGFRRCSTDPNRVRALLKFPERHDLLRVEDGPRHRRLAQGVHRSQFGRSLRDVVRVADSHGQRPLRRFGQVPLRRDPHRGRRHERRTEFRDKTGVGRGDLGVVVFGDKVVPVFVADGGPRSKLGEGSAALFRELGEDRCREMGPGGHCKRYRDVSIERGVLFFLFPGSRVEGLTPDNALETIRREALRRFAEL